MNLLTVGIVGCGRICNGAHVPALKNIDGIKVKYACDLIAEKAETVKEKLGGGNSLHRLSHGIGGQAPPLRFCAYAQLRAL